MRILSRIRASPGSECTDESRDSLNFRGSNPQLQKFLLGDLRRGALILPAVMSVGIFLSCREAGAVIPGSEPNKSDGGPRICGTSRFGANDLEATAFGIEVLDRA